MNRWAIAQPKATSRQSGPRAGLTLIELLLVLSVLLVAGYFSSVALQSTFAVHDLEKAAEFIRKNIAEGRARAIEAGLTYQLRFEPGKNRFVMVPDPNDIDDTTDGSEYFRMSGAVYEAYELRKELDAAGPGESLSSEWFDGMDEAGELASASWSEPIEFSFEGSADDGVFYLLDQQKRSIRIDVRGLTGAVNVSEVSWEVAEQ